MRNYGYICDYYWGMKLFWAFIIGVGLLLLMGASFGGSILIVGTTCLIIAVVISSAKNNREGENKQQPKIHTDGKTYPCPVPITVHQSYPEKKISGNRLYAVFQCFQYVFNWNCSNSFLMF
jgi:hypothetical protein